MTTTNPSRRQTRRSGGRGQAPVGRDGRSAVGERLRDAREIKGIDLFRAERDTKIRSKYLAALEDGDFTDLPGDVYTRGFIRNYATYLGLDADEIAARLAEADRLTAVLARAGEASGYQVDKLEAEATQA